MPHLEPHKKCQHAELTDVKMSQLLILLRGNLQDQVCMSGAIEIRWRIVLASLSGNSFVKALDFVSKLPQLIHAKTSARASSFWIQSCRGDFAVP